MREFDKTSGYKINTRKSTTFAYTNDSMTEKELVSSDPFTITAKLFKYLETFLTKCLRHLCNEICKTLQKEVENTQNWENCSCSWIDRISIIKLSILRKAIYILNMIPINILCTLFSDLEKDDANIPNMETKETPKQLKQS